MRRSMIAMFTLFAVTVQAPQRAEGGAFATEFTQILNHAQLVMQYLRQAEQLTEAIKQTAFMLQNSKILSGQVFGPIQSDLDQLASVVQGGMALSYSLANLDALFRLAFLDTPTTAQVTSLAIETGPRHRSTPRSARCAPQAFKASSFKASSPCCRCYAAWLRRRRDECRPCK